MLTFGCLWSCNTPNGADKLKTARYAFNAYIYIHTDVYLYGIIVYRRLKAIIRS